MPALGIWSQKLLPNQPQILEIDEDVRITNVTLSDTSNSKQKSFVKILHEPHDDDEEDDDDENDDQQEILNDNNSNNNISQFDKNTDSTSLPKSPSFPTLATSSKVSNPRTSSFPSIPQLKSFT